MKINKFNLEEKLSFEMLGLSFPSELDLGSYIVSIAKTAFKNIGVLIRSMTFLSFEAPLYLCKSTTQSYMEYCCHGKAGALSCFLYMLYKLQSYVCQSVKTPEFFACRILPFDV